MLIRPYGPGDETVAIDLWNDCLPMDQIDRFNFYTRVVYDVNFDPGRYLLAFEASEPAGFLYCTRRVVADEISGMEADKAWIVAMGVRPALRRKGVGGALVKRAETLLSGEGATQIDVGTYATNYFCPGVDVDAYGGGVPFFEILGYTVRGECCSMDVGLHDYVYPEKYGKKRAELESRGFVIKHYEARDALPLFRFMRESFPHWLPNVRACVLSGRAEERVIVALDAAGDAVGFAMRAMDGTEERFGPFGVKPALQGVGLGSLLFHEMMLSMVRRRVFYAYFLWTGGRNLDIYASWGMKIYRTYKLMGKNMDPAQAPGTARTGQAL